MALLDRSRWRILLSVFLLLSGCHLAGTWRAEGYDSSRSLIPIEVVSFEGTQYTATTDENGMRRTTVGSFRQTPHRLILHPANGAEQVYRLERTMGGQIRLSSVDETAGSEMTYKRVDEEPNAAGRPR